MSTLIYNAIFFYSIVDFTFPIFDDTKLPITKVVDKEKAYPVELEYTWSRQIIRKTTNVFVKVADWNQNGNQGRGEIRASYGGEFKRLNQLLLARVERIDSQLA